MPGASLRGDQGVSVFNYSFTQWRIDHPGAIDLGSAHYLTPYVLADAEGIEHTAGWIVCHALPDGTTCGGSIPIRGVDTLARQSWVVESWDPLTLSPSVLCSCGDHGYIRDGGWARA